MRRAGKDRGPTMRSGPPSLPIHPPHAFPPQSHAGYFYALTKYILKGSILSAQEMCAKRGEDG
jgi:hypothetical protein